MFYNSGDFYSVGAGVSPPVSDRGSIPSTPTEMAWEKLFADAYGYQPTAITRQELLAMERLVLAEIFLMAMMYQYYERLNRYYAPYNENDWDGQFRYWGPHIRHWVRPRVWLHEAQKTEHNFVGAALAARHRLQDWSQSCTGLANKLITDARHNIGQPVWAFTKFASVCQAGNLGCAATVSELLQEAGVHIPGSAGVYGLVDQLSAAGWQKIKISDKQQFRPGDIVFGVHGSHGHIGIISETNNDRVLVCDNSSASGTLKERTIESGGSFSPDGRFAGSLYVMRRTS